MLEYESPAACPARGRRMNRCEALVRLVILTLLVCACPWIAAAQSGADTPASLLNSGAYAEARTRYALQLESGDDVEGYIETYLQTAEFAQGLERVEDLLRRWPESPFVHYAQGRLLVASGSLAAAESAFREAIRRKGDYWLAGLALADLYRATGRERQARSLYEVLRRRYKQGLFTSPDDLGVAGRAATRLREMHDANEALRLALELDGTHVRNLFWRAQLFAETHDDAFARELYEKAISVNPHRAELFVGLAQVTDGFAAKEALARQALDQAPDLPGALAELARLAILDGAYGEASRLVEHALEINPASVQCLARLGTIRYLQADTAAFSALEARAMQVNAASALFHRTVSEDLALRFRYPAAADFAREAVRRDPLDASANAVLGTGLLRLGRSSEARPYLERSYERDAFNLYVANTVSLLDAYEEFDELESPNFRLLIHQDEAAVLGPAILREAEQALASFLERYPYRTSGKIRIEAYNDPDDFAVRVAGIPHVGLLGVSFGDVVALNTPRAQQGRPYNWARTLWHEIGHTVAIGVSRNHVPRWLTEGLSVYEEAREHPAWHRKLEPALLRAFERGRLLALESMDRGFTRPSFPGQVLLSYYHASEVVTFLVDHHGFEAMTELLLALAQGLDEEEAVQRAFGQSRRVIDEQFRNSLRARLDSLDFALQLLPDPLAEELTGQTESPFMRELEQGNEALASGRLSEAEASFTRALAMYPAYVGANDAYRGLAAVFRRRGDTAALAEILERYLSVTEYGAAQARELAELRALQGEGARAIALLEQARMTEPYHIPTLERLAELHEEAGALQSSAQARRAVIALNPVDLADAYYRLAATLYKAADCAAARRAVLHSLELAPGFRAAQRLLLACVDPNS